MLTISHLRVQSHTCLIAFVFQLALLPRCTPAQQIANRTQALALPQDFTLNYTGALFEYFQSTTAADDKANDKGQVTELLQRRKLTANQLLVGMGAAEPPQRFEQEY